MSRGALKTIMALLWWLSTFLIWLHTLMDSVMICERSSFGSSTVSVRGFSWSFIFPPFLSPRRIAVSIILGRQCFSISTTVAPPVGIFFIRRIFVFYLILLFPSCLSFRAIDWPSRRLLKPTSTGLLPH